MLDASPVMIDGAPARDRADPGAESGGLAKLTKTFHRLKKDLLHSVVGIGRRDSTQQNAVNDARISAVESAERFTVAIDRCAHKPGILCDGCLVPDAPS
jgi:hypothetical protein